MMRALTRASAYRGAYRPGLLPAAALMVVLLGAIGVAHSARAAPATPVAGVTSPSCGAVQFGGTGSPSGVIVSDLPMVGGSRERSAQMVYAIRLALAQRHWRAGRTAVGYQVCNDALDSTGSWDPATCTANANAYAATPRLLGVLGTYNSGCAALIIPVLNRHAIAMVSPGNTLICLTQLAPGCPAGEPGSLYASGRRTYVRVVPNDAYQGAGLATFARQRRVRRPFILYAAADPTSLGQARTFRGAARALGERVVGMRAWDPKASDYRALMRAVARTHPDGLVLAGLVEENGGRLIKDKVATLGPNGAHVKLFAPDGFAQQSTISAAGTAARGMFVSLPGRDPNRLTGVGRSLERRLARQVAPAPVELFAPYAAQAADVLLDAIAKGTTTAGTASGLVRVKVRRDILGSFAFTSSGDPTVGPISVYRAAATLRFAAEEIPPRRVVAAARAGR